MYDVILGNYTGSDHKIELLEGAKPYQIKPFPIFEIHKETVNIEHNIFIKIGILKYKNNSKWTAPILIIPTKNGTVCFISDFRELNKRIKRKLFPIPKIQDLLLKLKNFKYAS